MVSIDSVPVDAVRQNKNIKLIITDKGGHLTWFEGIKPKRWHPKPIFEFIQETQLSWKAVKPS